MFIVDVMTLPLGGLLAPAEYLVIETADPLAPQYSKWSFYTHVNGKFRYVYERVKNGTHHQILPIGLGSAAMDQVCYAAYAPGDFHLEIQCAHQRKSNRSQSLSFEKHQDVICTEPIAQVY